MILLVLALGCQNPEVEITGILPASRADDAGPLAGAALELRDGTGARYSQTTTAATGEFSLMAPAGEVVFLRVDGEEGYAPAAFTGVTGLSDALEIDPAERVLYGFSTEELAAWRARFAGCPGVEDEGSSSLIAEVRVWELTDAAGDHPLITSAWGDLTPVAGGADPTPCYLTADGAAYDPTATETGAQGVFAFFGLDEGFYTLEVAYSTHPEAEPVSAWSEVYLRAGDVAPRFPAWVSWWEGR